VLTDIDPPREVDGEFIDRLLVGLPVMPVRAACVCVTLAPPWTG
jgi:hypothetical protein